MPMDHPFIPAPNGGLQQAATLLNTGIQGIGQAITANTERDRAQAEQEAGLMQKGYLKDSAKTITQTDPVTGESKQVDNPNYGHVKRDPNSQAAYDQDLQEKDPKSAASGFLRNYYKAALQQTNPQLANSITDDMSGYQLKQYESQLGGLIGKQAGAVPMQQRMQFQQGNQASHVADSFDKDHIITQLQTQQNQIQRDKHTLDNASTITPQIWEELQLGVANAISGGRSAAVATANKTEINTLDNQWTALKQRVSNHPEDIGSPEFKKNLSDVMDRLNQAYQNNMQARAHQIATGRSSAYQNNPSALNVLKEKENSYSNPSSGLINTQDQQSDPKVSSWAQDHGLDYQSALKILKSRGYGQ